MKIKSGDLISHVEKASMGGLVNEMVLDEKFTFAVTDESRSVLAFGKKEFVSDLGEIGVFNLLLFKNLIQYASTVANAQDDDLNVSVVEKRLVFSNGKNAVKFLLCNVKTISSKIDNIEETLKKLQGKECASIVLGKVDVSRCIGAISIINPEEILLSVKNGEVSCLIGKEVEHNTLLNLGKTNSSLSFDIRIKPDLFTKVLQVLPTDVDVTLELREKFPIIFSSEEYVFAISPIRED